MRFRIKTLVDVTETNARKGQEPLLVNQQANFNTLYNTIGLRTNPTNFKVYSNVEDIKGLGFGENYKGRQRVWTIDFFVEADYSTSVDSMTSDFDLIPIITDLEETANLDKGLFITHSNHGRTNIVFEEIDK
jgi:hypothetical protein